MKRLIYYPFLWLLFSCNEKQPEPTLVGTWYSTSSNKYLEVLDDDTAYITHCLINNDSPQHTVVVDTILSEDNHFLLFTTQDEEELSNSITLIDYDNFIMISHSVYSANSELPPLDLVEPWTPTYTAENPASSDSYLADPDSIIWDSYVRTDAIPNSCN